MRNINDNAVQDHLSENMKNYRMKYFRHKILMIYSSSSVITRNIMIMSAIAAGGAITLQHRHGSK